MPARRADLAPPPDERLLRLRDRLWALSPEPAAPDSPLRWLLGDPAFVARVVPLAARAVHALVRRPGRAETARRGASGRGRSTRRRARRRPLAVAAAVIAAAVIAAVWLAVRPARRGVARG